MGLSKKDKAKIEKLIKENKAFRDDLESKGITINNLERLYMMSDEAQAALVRAHYAAMTEGGIIIIKTPTEPPVPIDCGSGAHWDAILGKCVPDVVIPPVDPPVITGEKDQYGINKIYVDKPQGVLIPATSFKEEEFTRNYASGKPSENSYECEYKDSNKLENEEATFYCKINGFKNEPDTMSVKLLGNKHSDGSKDKWLIFEVMTDGSDSKTFEIEDPHPSNHGNHQKPLFNIDVSIVGVWIGFKAITYIDEAGKRHAETWLDFPTTVVPVNNWRKYIDIKDVEALDHGFLNATNGGALLRIDGTKKGDIPTTKYMSIREIVPKLSGTGPIIPPPIPEPCPPGQHRDEFGNCMDDTTRPPPEPEPSPIQGQIYDSNTDGKWNDGNARVVDKTDGSITPNGKGIEMHASGNPVLSIDGKGSAILENEDGGHGRTYVFVTNYSGVYEEDLTFLDTNVDTHTLQFRSRHNEAPDNHADDTYWEGNNFGGISFKVSTKDGGTKIEKFHNVHEDDLEKALPKPIAINQEVRVRCTFNDKDGGIYRKLEIDYKDGMGFKTVLEKTFSVPEAFMLDKAKFAEQSYFWQRINPVGGKGKIKIRNVKLTAT